VRLEVAAHTTNPHIGGELVLCSQAACLVILRAQPMSSQDAPSLRA
jgi:hypothetical protein